MKEPFWFGVPLIARAAARDWSVVERLIDQTLRSVRAQTDGDFRLIVAGHDRPGCWERLMADDDRFAFIAAHWPATPPTAANDDGGRKKWLIKDHVRAADGGLLMFLDADDLVDRELVRTARQAITGEHIGGVVAHGLALDDRTGKAAAFPIAGVFDGPFHRLCGSSTVARMSGRGDDPLGEDPYLALGSHHEWQENARRLGVRLAELPVWGAYLVGTQQSHSEHDGPYAAWRQEVVEGVRRVGEPVGAAFEQRFGVLPVPATPVSADAPDASWCDRWSGSV